ncbi:MAG: hypothetical protein K8F91_14055 [Candidatus Obscuribacterales bacterium]|nr:hypothetical protein [Candidatus Obscuribacterales bacterium]
MLNLKLRLEKLCDTRSWVRLSFADGTTLTGRVLRVGHDYVEMESYGDIDRPYQREFGRHLVPLNLVKFITIESSSFAEAERRRLTYMSDMEANPDTLPEIEK